MTFFGASQLSPRPNADDAPFWAHCAERRLAFQHCLDCGRVAHPPIGACPRCQSLRRGWLDAPADARVYSFTWVHTASHESVAGALPYNVAVVEFPTLADVRLVTNVLDVRPGELAIGDRVTLAWDDAGEGMRLPRFRKSK